MCTDLIVIRSVRPQDTAQVRFAEHDEVVESFATYRSDEPLNVAVMPRRAWRRGSKFSVESFVKPERRDGERARPENRQRKQLWPDHAQSGSLQENGAKDDQVEAQRVEICEPLEHLRHAGYREPKSAQHDRRRDAKERDRKRLLLRRAGRRN